MTIPETTTGRAKMALVHGHGERATAVIAEVVVRVTDVQSADWLRFGGIARFAPDVEKHLSTAVAPLVIGILDRLGVFVRGLDLSVVNVSTASATNNVLEVVGYSADVSVFLALLSAALDLPLRADLLATGHLASPAGDIAMVEELSAKVEAAVRQSIGMFVHPAVDRDDSLKTLSPDRRDRIVQALFSAGRCMRTVAVADVAELVEAVFAPEAIVLAGLRKGFFSSGVPPVGNNTPVNRAATVLSANGERRFWDALQEDLFAGRSSRVHELLAARAQFQIAKGRYPDGFGGQLLTVLMSVPPTVRRLKLTFPLLPMSACIRLSQLATEVAERDVPLLYDAVRGHLPGVGVSAAPPQGPVGQNTGAASTLDTVISSIDAQSLAQAVERPIDSAGASFLPASVTAESAEAFIETIAAFCLHLYRHCGHIDGPPDGGALKANAIDLLERAFVRHGGFRAALAESMEPVRGGLRFVIGAMTDQYRLEEKRKHKNRVMKESLDPLDRAARTACMAELLERLKPYLPAGMPLQPAEYYAGRLDEIVEAYVEAFDSVSRLLSTY